MKRVLLSVTALALTLALFTGCGTIVEGFQEGLKEGLQESLGQSQSKDIGNDVQTITSDFSALSVDFPKAWKTEALNDIAEIQMAQVSKEQYMIVIEESSEDFDADFTLADYTEIILYSMESAIETVEASAVADVAVGDGISAKQFELTGSVNKIKVKYLVTCIETEGFFHQFTAWSLHSKYNDAKPVFDTILNSISF